MFKFHGLFFSLLNSDHNAPLQKGLFLTKRGFFYGPDTRKIDMDHNERKAIPQEQSCGRKLPSNFRRRGHLRSASLHVDDAYLLLFPARLTLASSISSTTVSLMDILRMQFSIHAPTLMQAWADACMMNYARFIVNTKKSPTSEPKF